MEKSTPDRLLDAGLELLGGVGFRGWSVRAAEDVAGVPHGSARHHFGDQRGLVRAMVARLLELDRPRKGETPEEQVRRWVGPDAAFTRARYELIVASFHDAELAADLTRGRDAFVTALEERGMAAADAASLVAALDGHLLDAVLRRHGPTDPAVDPRPIIERFVGGRPS
ncbi:TetR/AcrR family transcriptional regulator [Tsukamurella sp. 1534]|uniref:TetR/AcrR family transcriptional regulator n=1 Tax=Tsukamurella sp. 1534 TaxID=1151061 RepID=UPI00031F8EEF|nr:TetR/AcrR family transcriptional regulator [Tsukamurella sp. 1534]